MQVKIEALQRALKLLAAAGCKYAIIDADGKKYGELEVAEQKSRTRIPGLHPRGTYKAHFVPMLKDVKPGSMITIPYGQFSGSKKDKDTLRSAVCGWCSNHWGNQTYISHMNETGIELLRVE